MKPRADRLFSVIECGIELCLITVFFALLWAFLWVCGG